MHISYGSGYYYLLLILLLLECIWEAIISFIAVGDSILYQAGSAWGKQLNVLRAETAASSRRGSWTDALHLQTCSCHQCWEDIKVFNSKMSGLPQALLISQPSERMFSCRRTSDLKTLLQLSDVSLSPCAFVAAQLWSSWVTVYYPSFTAMLFFTAPPHGCFHSILSFLFGFEPFLKQDRKTSAKQSKNATFPSQKLCVWLVVRALKLNEKMRPYLLM